jgi:hypothetical protein
VRLVVVEFGSNDVVVDAFGSKLVVGPSIGMTPGGSVVVVVGVPTIGTVGIPNVVDAERAGTGDVDGGAGFGKTVFDAGTTGTVGAVTATVVVVGGSVDVVGSPELGISGTGATSGIGDDWATVEFAKRATPIDNPAITAALRFVTARVTSRVRSRSEPGPDGGRLRVM